VRAINVTYRAGNPCNFQSGEARLYVADVGVRLKNGTSLAKSSFKVAATPSFSGTYPLSASIDASNSTYYASLGMTWLEWWVLGYRDCPPCCARIPLEATQHPHLSSAVRFWLDLGRDVPMADILYYYHKQDTTARPSAQKCYQILWKDSSNTTIQANYFASTAEDNYYYPGTTQWGTAPSLCEHPC
jgi:hypothetical protein